MPNLQALTRSQEIRVLTAQGYALGRLDERDGVNGTRDATAIAMDFGTYVHDVEPGRAIGDAWATYVTDLEVLALADVANRRAIRAAAATPLLDAAIKRDRTERGIFPR